MVLGLLTIAALPTTIGVAEAVSAQRRENEKTNDETLLRKFKMECWCEGTGRTMDQVHGGEVVLGNGKVWVQSPKAKPAQRFHGFRGFYIAYPDDERPSPAPMGLVSTISDDPPMLNWIYINPQTSELKYGNRTQSRPHYVGSWGWTTGDEEVNDEEPGGLVLEKEEKFVLVEPRERDAVEGRWEVMWDEKNNGLKDVVDIKGRKVLRVSLERDFVEPIQPTGSKPAENVSNQKERSRMKVMKYK